MATALWNCCRLSTCSVYTIQLCTSLQCHFIWRRMCWVSVCLNCSLPPALLAEWLKSYTYYYSDTGMEWILKQKSAQKVDPREENASTALVGTWTCNILTRSLVLYHWAIPAVPLSYPCSTTELSVLYHWAVLVSSHSHLYSYTRWVYGSENRGFVLKTYLICFHQQVII